MNERKTARVTDSSSPPALLASGILQRKCGCGQHTIAGGQCDACRGSSIGGFSRGAQASSIGFGSVERSPRKVGVPAKSGDLSGVALHGRDLWRGTPLKSLTETPEEDDERKPRPSQGSATIQCDGSGGYEIVYNGWAGATCGTKACVTAHESSHIADWQAKWPTGCTGQAKGYLPKGDAPDNPLMSVSEYESFLKDSECKAHTVDLACAEALTRSPGCETTIDDYIELTRKQKKEHCGMSRGAKIGLGLIGGALAGAGIGFLAGGPVGAAIGAGIGLVAGLIGGALI